MLNFKWPKEGLFVGMSSEDTLFIANQIGKLLKTGNIVVIMPDKGEKYLSTELITNKISNYMPVTLWTKK